MKAFSYGVRLAAVAISGLIAISTAYAQNANANNNARGAVILTPAPNGQGNGNANGQGNGNANGQGNGNANGQGNGNANGQGDAHENSKDKESKTNSGTKPPASRVFKNKTSVVTPASVEMLMNCSNIVTQKLGITSNGSVINGDFYMILQSGQSSTAQYETSGDGYTYACPPNTQPGVVSLSIKANGQKQCITYNCSSGSPVAVETQVPVATKVFDCQARKDTEKNNAGFNWSSQSSGAKTISGNCGDVNIYCPGEGGIMAYSTTDPVNSQCTQLACSKGSIQRTNVKATATQVSGLTVDPVKRDDFISLMSQTVPQYQSALAYVNNGDGYTFTCPKGSAKLTIVSAQNNQAYCHPVVCAMGEFTLDTQTQVPATSQRTFNCANAIASANSSNQFQFSTGFDGKNTLTVKCANGENIVKTATSGHRDTIDTNGNDKGRYCKNMVRKKGVAQYRSDCEKVYYSGKFWNCAKFDNGKYQDCNANFDYECRAASCSNGAVVWGNSGSPSVTLTGPCTQSTGNVGKNCGG